MTLTDRGDPLEAEVALRGDEGGEVVLREGEAGEETEETEEEGEAGSREVGEVVDGIKVEEEEEEEAGGWRGEVEVEAWKEGRAHAFAGLCSVAPSGAFARKQGHE